MKLLSQLLQGMVVVGSQADCEISGLTQDSREVKPGYLFVARQGEKSDGHQFIPQAISLGAVAIICETEKLVPNKNVPKTIPIIPIKELTTQLGIIAARFFDNPSAKLTVIGITGTNGKTSCSHYIAQALTRLGTPCAAIGTIGYGLVESLINYDFTTPEPIQLQAMLAEVIKLGAKAVAMEVSSHSLMQQRVSGVEFDIAVFTNLTRDHLDYHHSMENYAEAKRRLFTMPTIRAGIFNVDDVCGQQWLSEFSKQYDCCGYSQVKHNSAANNLLVASNIKLAASSLSADISTPWGQSKLNSGLLGYFNLSNLLAVLSVLGVMGCSLKKSLQVLSTITPVKGRLQIFKQETKPMVVIDYAHTPNALQQVLITLRPYVQGQLWCVFGCGGERDKGKRAVMAHVAEHYADKVVVTDDNPRYEDSAKIIADVRTGFIEPDAVYYESQRELAVCYAVEHAKEGDVVLVAGKGHEDYQFIKGKKVPCSDIKVVESLLKG